MNERETAALQVEDLTYNADGLIPCIVSEDMGDADMPADDGMDECRSGAPHHQPGYNLVLVA